MIKQLQDTCEQIEQNYLALSTFKFFAEQESIAIPRRLESLTEDVKRQIDREKELQARYAALKEELEDFKMQKAELDSKIQQSRNKDSENHVESMNNHETPT